MSALPLAGDVRVVSENVHARFRDFCNDNRAVIDNLLYTEITKRSQLGGSKVYVNGLVNDIVIWFDQFMQNKPYPVTEGYFKPGMWYYFQPTEREIRDNVLNETELIGRGYEVIAVDKNESDHPPQLYLSWDNRTE